MKYCFLDFYKADRFILEESIIKKTTKHMALLVTTTTSDV